MANRVRAKATEKRERCAALKAAAFELPLVLFALPGQLNEETWKGAAASRLLRSLADHSTVVNGVFGSVTSDAEEFLREALSLEREAELYEIEGRRLAVEEAAAKLLADHPVADPVGETLMPVTPMADGGQSPRPAQVLPV